MAIQERTHFKLRETLRQPLKQLAQRGAAKGLVVTMESEPDLPEELVGDSSALCRIVTELVDNAIKFSAHGSVSVRVAEAYRDAEELCLCFSVADSGPGLAQEKSAELFTPTAASDHERGLLVVHRLVERLGGDISVESMPGQGSIFQFTMPCKLAAPGHESAVKRKILLVDDVEINQELARVVMERQGHDVTLASNGEEAVEAFSSARFDIIFMDIQMPVMDGYQASRAIREAEYRQGHGSHVPIVAMTAYASDENRRMCMEAGMDHFISKPVKPDEIISCIRRFSGTGEHHAHSAAHLPSGLELTEETPVFDRCELLDRLCGKGEMIPRFAMMFIDTTAHALEQLDNAVATADGDEIHRQAHTIKGAAANIGAARIRIRATQLDETAKAGRLEETPALLETLRAEFIHFQAEVAEHLGNASA